MFGSAPFGVSHFGGQPPQEWLPPHTGDFVYEGDVLCGPAEVSSQVTRRQRRERVLVEWGGGALGRYRRPFTHFVYQGDVVAGPCAVSAEVVFRSARKYVGACVVGPVSVTSAFRLDPDPVLVDDDEAIEVLLAALGAERDALVAAVAEIVRGA